MPASPTKFVVMVVRVWPEPDGIRTRVLVQSDDESPTTEHTSVQIDDCIEFIRVVLTNFQAQVTDAPETHYGCR